MEKLSVVMENFSANAYVGILVVNAGIVSLSDMVTTKIVNLTGFAVQLKEGNAGVTSSIKIVQPGKSEKVSVDPNATYRTYVIASTDLGGHLLDLNSDFCIDYRIVYIRIDVDKKKVFKDPVPRSAKLLPSQKLANKSSKKIALSEVVTQNSHHGLSITVLATLDPGMEYTIRDVDFTAELTGEHRKYYVTVPTAVNETEIMQELEIMFTTHDARSEDKIEITEELKKKYKHVDVTFSSDKLQVHAVRCGFFG